MKRALLLVGALMIGGAEAPPDLTVTLAPQPLQGEEAGGIAVTVAVDKWEAPAGQPLFTLGVMAPGMPSPQPVDGFELRDGAGVVPVTATTADGEMIWSAARAISGAVAARYRLAVDNARGSSPPVALRIDGDAVSAPGRALIAIPQLPLAEVVLRWDLNAAGAGSQGVSSWGDGNADIGKIEPSQLRSGLFMGGHLERFDAGAFAAVWGKTPPFDPRPPMVWSAKLHHWMSGFWGDSSEPPYRVFLRANPANPGGGAALHHAFVVGWGPETTGPSLTAILGHEMTHTWTANEALGKWYSEGNAVFYQARLPWLAGLTTSEDYLADINLTASRYYTNAMRATPEAEVMPKFWDDTRIRVLPYDRGALYFAAIDGIVRRKSAGRKSVDDLVREMNLRRDKGEALDESDWVDLLVREGGSPAETLHRAMMAGKLVLPASGDFGACFRRIKRPIPQFDIGFDMSSLLGQRVVTGLKKGSNAARAGVRDGDRIVQFSAGDAVQRDVSRRAVITVARDSETLRIDYLPRGKAVPAYQWQRNPAVPESQCRPTARLGEHAVPNV